MSSTSSEPPRLGQVFRVEAQADEAVQLMVSLLDMQDSAPSIRRLRDWALAAAQVRVGEVVVDVGSGTGTMARELAGLVGPAGRTIGVEPNPRLRAIAVQRVTSSNVGSTSGPPASPTFVDGLATDLPFEKESVDLVWCERVLQHLEDPRGAMSEFARILRPSGRVIILDSDHGSRVTSDVDPVIDAKLSAAMFATMPNARAARHVPRQAMEAGFFVDPDIGSSALVMMRPPPGAPSLLGPAVRQAVAVGALTAEEGEQAVARQQEAAAAGHAFAAVTVFGFVLRLADPSSVTGP